MGQVWSCDEDLGEGREKEARQLRQLRQGKRLLLKTIIINRLINMGYEFMLLEVGDYESQLLVSINFSLVVSKIRRDLSPPNPPKQK